MAKRSAPEATPPPLRAPDAAVNSPSRRSRPLLGVRVLDLSRLLPGPYLTLILADMGADVVKVEEPQRGDYLRYLPPHHRGVGGRFLAINRDKRSLALDLKSESGRMALLRMCERADVVVESFRPGVLKRLGVSPDAMREQNSKLVVCSISGYGQSGPYAARAGHDLNYVALAGLLAPGRRGAEPAVPSMQVADLAGGALWGATAILGALYARERGGDGDHLDISMTEGTLALLATEYGSHAADPDDALGGADLLTGGRACYNIYRTADGKFLSVAALEPKFWLNFNRAIGREGNLAELLDPALQEPLIHEIQARLLLETRQQWIERLAAVDCCCEPILDRAEVVAHPQHRAREVFFQIPETDDGFPQIRLPVGDARGARLAPALGEDSAEVLRDYGFSEEEISQLLG